MSKPKRRNADDMRLITLAEQQEIQQRLGIRRDVEDAMKRLAAALLAWLDQDERRFKAFVAQFQASGHRGEYHENPNDTTRRRTLAAQVKARLRETPLNWMGAVELSYVIERVEGMIEVLDEMPHNSVPLAEILQIYAGIGDAIRTKVHTETGHWPEQFPVPSDRITGDESDDLFKLTDHQPPLF